METTIASSFWFVVFACVGGAIVLVGLLMEALAEKKWFKNVKDFRRWAALKKCGEWLVIAGIVIEVVVAGLSAKDEWESALLNRPMSDVAALVSFDVKGGDFKEIDVRELTHGRSTWVAYLNLLEANNQPSHLPPGSLYADSLTTLFSEESLNSDRKYVMRFNLEWASPAFNQGPAKDINKIKSVAITAFFLPTNTEILGGNAEIVINGSVHKSFTIFPQIAAKGGMFSVVIGTNSSSRNLERRAIEQHFDGNLFIPTNR